MVKFKFIVEIVIYGIYLKWDVDDKVLFKIKIFINYILLELDIEFGFIVNIKCVKNSKVCYCIYYFDILDEDGIFMLFFDGEEYVCFNNWDFYLGDMLWELLENKVGDWCMMLEFEGKIIVDKIFIVEDDLFYDGVQFW